MCESNSRRSGSLSPSPVRCTASSPGSRQRRGAKTTRLRRPRTRTLVCCAALVHRIPRQRFVTIAIRPFHGRETGELLMMICPSVERNIFVSGDGQRREISRSDLPPVGQNQIRVQRRPNAIGEAPGRSAAFMSVGCCAKLAPNDRLRFEVGRNSTPALTR